MTRDDLPDQRVRPELAIDVRALLLDLDGVLYVENEPIAGAAGAVAALRVGARVALRHEYDRPLSRRH